MACDDRSVRKTRRRILICGNGNVTGFDGVWRLHGEVARFLRECSAFGFEVGYASIGLNAQAEQRRNLANTDFPSGVRRYFFRSWSNMSRAGRLLYLPVLLIGIARMVRGCRLVYCYYPGSLTRLVVECCRIMKVPYALYVRGELRNTAAVRRELAAAEFILATGTSIVTRVTGPEAECEEVVPMSSVFRNPPASRLRTAPSGPAEGLFVGRVEPGKGVVELLDALVLLRDRGMRLAFTFVGACPDWFSQAVEERGLHGRVTVAGLVGGEAELEKYYQKADFLCLPTHSEGFPRVLYEAMAYGVPCITTMVGGIPSRMRDGVNCLAVKVGDAVSIAGAMERLLKEPGLIERLSASSRSTFEELRSRFKDDSHAAQLYRKYRECLSGGNRGGKSC